MFGYNNNINNNNNNNNNLFLYCDNTTSLCNVLYFMNCLLIDIALDVRKLLLLKSCFESTTELVRLSGLIRFNDDDAMDLF